MARRAAAAGDATSIALVGNAADIEPAWAKAGERFDVVTDQTSAHDALAGYVPGEISLHDAHVLRVSQPDVYMQRSMRSMADHVRAMLAFQQSGSVVFDYGNNLRAQAQEAGVANAFDYPGFVPAFIRPQFCEGRGPFRWVALSATQRTSAARTEALAERPTTAGCGAGWSWREARVPFHPGPYLLAGLRRARQGRPRVQPAGGVGRGQGADRHWGGRPPRRGVGRDHPTASGMMARRARRRRPTGRSSTRSSTRWPAPPGCRSTTVAGGDRVLPARRAWWRRRRTELAARKLERGRHERPRHRRGASRGRGLRRHAIEIARERGVRIPMLDGSVPARG